MELMYLKQQEFHSQNKPRIKDLVAKFADYHPPPSSEKLKNFFNQFSLNHMSLGLKVLDHVCYFSHTDTINQIKLLASDLNRKVDFTKPNVYFSTMSLSSGTSSDTVMREVRHAADMTSAQYSDKFVHLRDLKPWQDEQDERTIIFVDDFIGSGQTVSHLWNIHDRWYNKRHLYYIGVVVGYEKPIKWIQEEMPFRVICPGDPLAESTRVFHDDNHDFSKKEKTALKKYCKMADDRKDFRYGYQNSQSLVVFYDNAPNNAIPILHHKSEKWKFPPFPRSG